MDYNKKVLLLIIISTIIRLFFASATELSADEAYYWTFAAHLQWNYFDHPPMVAWFIRLTTANLLLHNELYLRLGAVISSAISIWLIFRAGTVFNNLQTGWYAALLYSSSVFYSTRAGCNILPDSPQMIFWLASILLLFKIISLPDDDKKSDLLWCLFGLTSGFCIMSKVHGVFLWFGVLCYIFVVNRNRFRSRGIYLAAMITLIIISPIIIWNIQNHFISLKFHAGRASFAGQSLNLPRFFKAIFEEMLANNPINFFLIIAGIVQVVKGEIPGDQKKMLFCCSLPIIATVLIISLFRETFSYWSGPGYSCLLIIPAANLASVVKNKSGKVYPLSLILRWRTLFSLLFSLFVLSIISPEQSHCRNKD